MRRRDFIALVSMGMLAGCGTESVETVAGGDGGDGSTPTPTRTPESEGSTPSTPAETESPTPTPEPTPTGTPTPSPTPEPAADVAIASSELVTREGEFSTTKFVAATVENRGTGTSGQVELVVRWYDGDGNYLDNASEFLYSLAAGETWEARVPALTDTEAIEDFEIEGSYAEVPPRVPDGVTLTTSSLATQEDDVVVAGEVENGTGGELSYLEACSKLYDDSGAVLDSAWTNVTDIPADETWAFENSFLVYSRVDQVARHEVVLGT